MLATEPFFTTLLERETNAGEKAHVSVVVDVRLGLERYALMNRVEAPNPIGPRAILHSVVQHVEICLYVLGRHVAECETGIHTATWQKDAIAGFCLFSLKSLLVVKRLMGDVIPAQYLIY